MRKIQYLILGFIALLTVVGCNDDEFLLEEPKTIYTIDNAFDKSSQVDAQLVRAYSSISGLYCYGFDATNNYLHGAGADYFDITNFLCGKGASGFSNYASWTTTTGRFTNLWNSLYQMVSYANLAMLGAEKVTWDNPADKDYAVAQAKFFRGWAYLRLAECFGGVPIVEEYSEVLKLDYVRATRAETYEFAINDLTDAVAGLTDYPKEDGRVAKGAANHFLAEAYLGLGIETGNTANYSLAITAAQATISAHPLKTSRFGSRSNPADMSTMNGVRAYKAEGNVYYDLFQIGNYDYSKGNTESVWAIQFPDYDTYTASNNRLPRNRQNWVVGPVFRDMRWRADLLEAGVDPCPWNGNVDVALYPGKANSAYCGGESIGRIAATKYISDKVWSGAFATDMRNDSINICRQFICINRNHSLYGQVVTADMLIDPSRLFPLWSKMAMQDEWGWHTSESARHQNPYGRDFYAVRSAETYMLLAEAYLRNGNTADAAIALNTVRQRAQATKLYTAAEVDIYAILDERAREVVYEEHRWPTLLRIGGDVMVNQLMNNAMYVADQPYFVGTIAWRLFPIPLSVIQMNSGATMDQNPGWE